MKQNSDADLRSVDNLLLAEKCGRAFDRRFTIHFKLALMQTIKTIKTINRNKCRMRVDFG